MRKLITIFVTGLILIQVLYVQYGIIANPLPTGDAYGIWFLKAKAISLSNSSVQFVSFLKDNRYAYSHPEYPIVWPLILALFTKRIEFWMAFYPIIFIIIIYLTYDTVKKKSNNLVGILAAFAISSIVIVERASGRNEVGFADLPLALFFTMAVWIYLKDKINWVFLSLVLGVAANIKIEGLLGVLIFVLIVKPSKKQFWMIFLPFAIFWPVCTYVFHLKNIYQGSFNVYFIFNHLDRLMTIFNLACKEMFNLRAYGFWLVIFVLSLFTKTDYKSTAIKKWIFLYLACLIGSFIFTPLSVSAHWNSSFYRIVLGVLPIIISNSFIISSAKDQ